jgi:hypothetical protein
MEMIMPPEAYPGHTTAKSALPPAGARSSLSALEGVKQDGKNSTELLDDLKRFARDRAAIFLAACAAAGFAASRVFNAGDGSGDEQ